MDIRIEVWGRTDYRDSLKRQQQARDRVIRKKNSTGLIAVTEHQPVITIGKTGDPKHLKRSPDELRAQGIEFVRTDRGGDVTYHGPGQATVYPIIDLKALHMGLREYLRNLEIVGMSFFHTQGVPVKTREGFTGLWTTGGKIASIGIGVKQWVTCHGISLNIHTQADGFHWIVPCGISGCIVTSLQDACGRTPNVVQAGTDYAERLKTFLQHKHKTAGN